MNQAFFAPNGASGSGAEAWHGKRFYSPWKPVPALFKGISGTSRITVIVLDKKWFPY